MEAQIREIIIARNDVRIVFETSPDGSLRTKSVPMAVLQRHPVVGPLVDEVARTSQQLFAQLETVPLSSLIADENPPGSESPP